MSIELPDPQDFIDSYDQDVLVGMGDGTQISLSQALEAERLLCPADISARQDPVKRLGYLANMLAAAGSLKPQHSYLLDSIK